MTSENRQDCAVFCREEVVRKDPGAECSEARDGGEPVLFHRTRLSRLNLVVVATIFFGMGATLVWLAFDPFAPLLVAFAAGMFWNSVLMVRQFVRTRDHPLVAIDSWGLHVGAGILGTGQSISWDAMREVRAPVTVWGPKRTKITRGFTWTGGVAVLANDHDHPLVIDAGSTSTREKKRITATVRAMHSRASARPASQATTLPFGCESPG